MSTKTILLSSITALTLSGVSAPLAADGVAHDRSKSPSRLEGAWQVTVTPYVCATGELQFNDERVRVTARLLEVSTGEALSSSDRAWPAASRCRKGRWSPGRRVRSDP